MMDQTFKAQGQFGESSIVKASSMAFVFGQGLFSLCDTISRMDGEARWGRLKGSYSSKSLR